MLSAGSMYAPSAWRDNMCVCVCECLCECVCNSGHGGPLLTCCLCRAASPEFPRPSAAEPQPWSGVSRVGTGEDV